MLFVLRIVLVVGLIALLVRAFTGLSSSGQNHKSDTKRDDRGNRNRKVSSQTGDYVDYEELKED